MKDKAKPEIKLVRLPEQTHHKVRLFSAKAGLTIQDWVTLTLEKAMRESKTVKS